MPVRVDTSLVASELRVVLGQLMRRLRTEHRFPLSHGAVLGRLDRQGPLSTVELASAERVRPQSMGQTLAELETQGLVSRRPDEADGRRTLLELTDAGRQTLAEDRQRREGWLTQAIEQEFSGEEQEVLAQAIPLLARLTEL
ncbi:MAG TPA: MarR family transcriptional regulator [Solirubrobacteraceae bacterium]|nr:MarR family transcriptional regulator [Solirubrobacteraceae bacterium]